MRIWKISYLINYKSLCSTETDSQGNHATGQEIWGNGVPECPALSNREQNKTKK